MTRREFIEAMYRENALYNDPEQMAEEDAAYNIRCYREDGIPVPPTVTAKTFAYVWNRLYQIDTMSRKLDH